MRNLSFDQRKCKEILAEYKEEELRNRFNNLLSEMEKFIDDNNLVDQVCVNHFILGNAIIDYYYDIMRLKDFHKKTKKANSQKVIAYSSYWFLVKKPIQIVNNASDNKALLTVNERFVLQYILTYLSERERDAHILLRDNPGLKSFSSYLLYYLVYRVRDAQSLEMMIVSFFAGQIYERTDEDISDLLHPFDC